MQKYRDVFTSDKPSIALYVSAIAFLLLSLHDGLEQTFGVWPPVAMAIVAAVTAVYVYPLYKDSYRLWKAPVLMAIGFAFGLIEPWFSTPPRTMMSPGAEKAIARLGIAIFVACLIGVVAWMFDRKAQRS